MHLNPVDDAEMGMLLAAVFYIVILDLGRLRSTSSSVVRNA